MARAVLPGVPHHLTQRGVERRDVFFDPSDYEVYIELVTSRAARFGVDLLAYCCMTNHVHWVVAPQGAEALARTFGEAHGRYASYANAKLVRSGHFWHNRFFSCALDRAHLWAALSYVERNPLRAGLVQCAHAYRWSSAAAHCGVVPAADWLARGWVESEFTAEEWAAHLHFDAAGEEEARLRTNTYTGRPCGSVDFVAWTESRLGRKLAPQRGGRRPRAKSAAVGAEGQANLFD